MSATTQTSARRARLGGPLPIGPDLFKDALARERKRADRFEVSFVLVRISFARSAAAPARQADRVKVLRRMTLDADLVGWFERGAVLGLLRSLEDGGPVDAEETTTTRAVTISRAMLRGLTPDDAASCSIAVEVYPPQDQTMVPVPAESPDERRRWRDAAKAAAKRALDVTGSAGCLVALSPVFLFVAALVKFSSKGPVLFRQQRVGMGGQPFAMLKFRTMCVDADPGIHRQYVENFIQSRQVAGAGGNVVFKIVDDPRITRFGHFLRRSSLDELPQLWNVLRGEMSLVGPRPPLPYEVARYKRWHFRRVLDAKPGITGLWQVTGRSRTTFDEMVRLDVRYAANSSVWFDLKILLATPRAVLTGKGAH